MIADMINWALVMALPGPDIVAIASSTIRYGRSAGFRTATGVTLGVAIWSLLSLIGITAILNTVPVLRNMLPVIGALVLIGLGVFNLLKCFPIGNRANDKDEGSQGYSYSLPNAFRYGLLTNISNPKALVFFTAIFTPMMADYSGIVNKMLAFSMLIFISFLVFNAMAVMFSFFSSNKISHKRFFNIAPGVVFVFIGGYYLTVLLLR
ncbi:LysE family translocator [Halomonas sp. WWR20]